MANVQHSERLTGRSRRRPARAMWLSLLMGSAACTFVYQGDLDRTQCKRQSDCEADATKLGTPLECRQNVCQPPECSETPDCPTGSVCVDKLCVADSEGAFACKQDSDCGDAARRCGFDGLCYEKWGCLDDDPDWPMSEPPFTFVTRLVRAEKPTDPEALGKLDIIGCGSVDPNCDRPDISAAAIALSAEGKLRVPFDVTLPMGFTGVVRITSAAEEPDPILPTYRVFPSETPLVSDMVDPDPINVLGVNTFPTLASAFGLTIVEGTGFVEAHLYDCGGRPAPNVAVSAPGVPDANFIILSSSGPVEGATSTIADGAGTLLNLPAGESRQLVLRDEKLERVITDTLTIIVRGPAMNYLVYFPRYSAVKSWLEEAERQGRSP